MRNILRLLMLTVPVVANAQATRYRYESRVTSLTDMPGMEKKMAAAMSVAASMGEDVSGETPFSKSKENVETTLALLTITTRDSAGGVLWHTAIDSFSQDAGKQMSEAARLLGGAALAPKNYSGATIDFYVKDGHIISSSKTSLPREIQLMMLAEELRDLIPSQQTVKVGEIKLDSTFQDITTPGQAANSRSKTKVVTRTTRPGADTLVSAVRTLSHMDMGATAGSMLNSSTEEERWIYDPRAMVRLHSTSSESSMIMVNPISGMMVTRSTTTKALIRVP